MFFLFYVDSSEMNGTSGSSSQDHESLGPDWQASQTYIEIMTRRLRDSVGLHDDDHSRDHDGE